MGAPARVAGSRPAVRPGPDHQPGRARRPSLPAQADLPPASGGLPRRALRRRWCRRRRDPWQSGSRPGARGGRSRSAGLVRRPARSAEPDPWCGGTVHGRHRPGCCHLEARRTAVRHQAEGGHAGPGPHHRCAHVGCRPVGRRGCRGERSRHGSSRLCTAHTWRTGVGGVRGDRRAASGTRRRTAQRRSRVREHGQARHQHPAATGDEPTAKTTSAATSTRTSQARSSDASAEPDPAEARKTPGYDEIPDRPSIPPTSGPDQPGSTRGSGPSGSPVSKPSDQPSDAPSDRPSDRPSTASDPPSTQPSAPSSIQPSDSPSIQPSESQSSRPSDPNPSDSSSLEAGRPSRSGGQDARLRDGEAEPAR